MIWLNDSAFDHWYDSAPLDKSRLTAAGKLLSHSLSKDRVTIARIKSGQKTSISEAVESAVDLLGGIDVSQGDKIVIKPDLGTCRPPDSGTTTDVRVVEAILELIRRTGHDPRTYIVESDNHLRNANESFERYAQLRERYNVELVNLSTEKTGTVALRNGRIFGRLEVAKTLQEYDYFISVANLKIHAMEGISCVMKNQFGCIPDVNKSKFHPYMSEVLYDLNEFYNPNLCVAGGLFGKEFDRDLYLRTGYITGRPKPLNLIVCGKDAVATDTVCTRLMGFDPTRIPYLNYAMRHKTSAAEPILQNVCDPEVENLNFQFVPNIYFLRFRVAYKLLRLYNVLSRKRTNLFS